jgi:hypothetical protein
MKRAAPAASARWWRAAAPRRARRCARATAWPGARRSGPGAARSCRRAGLPVGEQGHAQRGREEGQFVGQALGVGRLGGNDAQQLPGCAARQRMAGQQQGVGRADGAGQREALAAGDGRQCMEGADNTKSPATAVAGRCRKVGKGRAWAGTATIASVSPCLLRTRTRRRRCAFALVPCAGVGQNAPASRCPSSMRRSAGRAMVAHTLQALAAWRAEGHAGGAGARRRLVRGRRCRLRGPARLGGALRRCHARRHAWPPAWPSCAPRRAARRLGAGARCRALPAAAGLGGPADRRLPG